jgi:hypothetical protein
MYWSVKFCTPPFWSPMSSLPARAPWVVRAAGYSVLLHGFAQSLQRRAIVCVPVRASSPGSVGRSSGVIGHPSPPIMDTYSIRPIANRTHDRLR